MTRCDRVLELMATSPAPKVKPIHTEQGCFVNRTLMERTTYFLTRAATPKKGTQK